VAARGWPWEEFGEALPASVVDRGRYYARHRDLARVGTHLSEAGALVLGAAVPVGAAFAASPATLAVLGAGAAIATGLGQAFGWRRNWIRSSSTAQRIENETVRFRARRGRYGRVQDPAWELALQVEAIVAWETDAWRVDSSVADATSSATGGQAPRPAGAAATAVAVPSDTSEESGPAAAR
jgi:hypothetical protein